MSNSLSNAGLNVSGAYADVPKDTFETIYQKVKDKPLWIPGVALHCIHHKKENLWRIRCAGWTDAFTTIEPDGKGSWKSGENSPVAHVEECETMFSFYIKTI